MVSAYVRAVVFSAVSAGLAAAATVPLAGEWRFALDPKNEGVSSRWFERRLEDHIRLPGTTDENRKGTPNQARETGRLTRVYPYAGAAWYQCDLAVPAEWAGRRAALFLERTKTSDLWVDGTHVGRQDSLVAPHVYPLGRLDPGRHQISLRIDNAEHAPIGDAQQISDQTQTNWNGIIGELSLEVTDLVWMDDIQVYPDVAARTVKVRVDIGNITGGPVSGQMTVSVDGPAARSVPFSLSGTHGMAETVVNLGDRAQLWDEFSPVLTGVVVSMDAGPYRDRKQVSFGMREFRAVNGHFRINGKTIFLRGNVDNCVFPITGYPPMTVEGWLRVFRIAKSYGLNHYRFHTWFPPRAAFEAADQAGVYLQPELPNWMQFGGREHDDFLRAEGERILKTFGNHPSFVMLSLGNELGGRQELMAPFVAHFRELDPRHLYAQGTNNWFPSVYPGDDYWASFQVRGKKIRASYATVDPPLGHVQTGPPGTMKDYRAEIAGFPVPVVSHEIGEYQVAPDFSEIAKYTGVVRAPNLEALRQRLEEHGMMDQAADFVQASGKLAVLCYREDIEAALRTHNMAGFQLLDLQDFPGQGTALVGILNAFMESKGLIEPAEFREFCSETVPLVRAEKYTWSNRETWHAAAEVAHYGAVAIHGATPVWKLTDGAGRVAASGRLDAKDIPAGGVTALGEVRIPLEAIPAPAALKLTLALEGRLIRNSYGVWVYPEAPDTSPHGVTLARTIEEARAALQAGGRVLLIPDPARLPGSIQGWFAPDFWNYGMFRALAEERKMPVAAGTLGILCIPTHAALAGFPTESHGNWQWFHLIQHSRAIILDAMPAGYRPIVQAIDTYERAHKLGVVFEARVGAGKLLVCAIDLPGLQDKPEARQLLASLLRYAESDRFAPPVAVEWSTLEQAIE